ncbi:MAG: hypothetical protein P8P74_18720 [Crocinitomicaceae bacterium]|nr:hypothetical protein [Crocinitomicaceae bacterium]
MKRTILGIVGLSLTFGVLYSCNKKDVSPNTSNESAEREQPTNVGKGTVLNEVDAVHKSLPFGATASAVSIHYLNQVGTGYSTQSTYWSKDFNGDGISDLLERGKKGKLFMRFATTTPSSPEYQYPDKVGDNLNGVTYSLGNRFEVGHGFNFVTYHLADFTGDGKCDLLCQASNGYMYMYHFNGSSFTTNGIQVRFGQAPSWGTNKKFFPADKNGDGIYEIVEIGDIGTNGSYQQTWKRWSATSTSWHSYGFQMYSTKVFDKNDEFVPVNIDGDFDVDFFIRKPNGILQYCKAVGVTSSFTTPIQCGTGWNTFTNIYGKYHWNCITANASLTGRKSNGDLYLYKWNSSSNSFSPGVKVGTGWNFQFLFTGNFCPDVSTRDDYMGLNSDGKLHAYTTLVTLN